MTREIREMAFSEVDLMINYFLNASDEYLSRLGVDRQKLPSLSDWQEMLRRDFESSYATKETCYVLWVLENELVGHSHIGKIQFGEEAFMHLHLWDSMHRKSGNGSFFIRESINFYFNVFELQNLFCEPHAINPAPNKTLAKIGFEFLKTYDTTPSWLNYHQSVNRWVLTRERFESSFQQPQ